MRQKHRTIWMGLLSTAAVAAVGFAAGEAAAQSNGQVIFTSKAAPEGLSKAMMNKFLKKNKLSVLPKLSGESSWEVHIYARLRSTPSAKWLKLAHNDGKLQLTFFKKMKRRWVQAGKAPVEYKPGSRLMSFPFKISEDHGVKPAGQYMLRIVVLDARKRPKTLASASFKTK